MTMKRTYDDSMFIEVFEHEYTWLNGFLRNAKRYADKAAVIDPEQNLTWTYDRLNRESNKFANALLKDGTGKNHVVMAALRNCPAFCTSYIGPRKIGAILLAANSSLASGEMALLIDHNSPKVLIYSASIKKVVMDALELCTHKPDRIIIADNIEKEDVPAGHVLYDEYVEGMSELEPEADTPHHIYDEVVRLCTSGTTALPKSVPINDINEVLSAHDVIMHYPMNCNDITLNMTPWFHRGGCHSGGPCPSFYVGAAVVVMRTFKPQTVLDWTAKYGITFIMGAPANLEMLSRAQEKKSRNLSSVRGIITMGGPLTRSDCIRYMGVLTPNIFNGYGTTETFWNSFLRPYNLPSGAGSVGASCIDDEVRVVKNSGDGSYNPDNLAEKNGKETGEVIIYSPGKTTYSYFNNREAQEEKFHGGWMFTGDIGTWNKDSVVTIHGRKDDMMIVSGENIFPQQIEDALLKNEKIRDCIVTSVPDKIRGQAIVAYVVADEQMTVSELDKFCSESPYLSKYKKPRYYAFTTDIPKTATGKKKRNEMKLIALEDLKNGKLFK